MHKADAVAQVLQLAQVVRGDDNGHPVLCDVLNQNALEQMAHNGVKPVEDLVEEQIPRAGRQREDKCRLTLHALRHIDDFILCVYRENRAVAHVRLIAPVRIKLAVERRGILDRAVVVKERKVGNEKALALCLGIVEKLPAVEQDTALFPSENAREHTQQGGFSAAVAADQAHNGAFPNGEIQAVDRDNLIEPFGKPFDFNQNITSLNKASR